MKITSTNGLQTAYDVFGTGDPILLLHGFGNDRTMWKESGWTDRLNVDFKVITMDFYGCGESDRPDFPSAYSIESHLDSIESVISACGGGCPMVWGWSLGATIALHLASRGTVSATISAGTYFGTIFTSTRVDAGVANATDEVGRARLRGMGTWPEVQPEQIKGRLLLYTGTNDGNVVKQLESQRNRIEQAGGTLKVLADCNHLELVTSTEKVADIVWPFIH